MKKNVVIAGGGTGGHIYPGIALAEKLKNLHPDYQVHFVGAVGGLEEKIVPHHGYPLHLLRVDRLHHSVGLWRRLKTLFTLPLAFWQSAVLYFRLKPQWVLGVGGFASGPFVFMAALLGGKTALLEPNAMPGLANRWLGKVVRSCFLVFSAAEDYFPRSKVQVVGLPVRLNKLKPEVSYKKQRPFRILIFGGSQGARAVNERLGAWVESLGPQLSQFEIYHQIGARDFAIWQKRYGDKYQPHLTYTEYIHDMPQRLQWADLVICRAGIGSVAEVAMCSKPALFIPLPTAADNHQVKNAQSLAEKGAALMIEEKDLDSHKLNQVLFRLKDGPEELVQMAERLLSVDYSTAPEKILQSLDEMGS